jgi:ornithine cyclodeaminase/alanine dehydrogenase-like protein (mu-crystallin family)
MKILILDDKQVTELLTMPACIKVMETALSGLARGAYQKPPGAAGLLGLMPAYRADAAGGGAFGLKAVAVFNGNPAIGLDSHQGAVLLFSGTTGEPMAVMSGSAITAIRTAAVSGVATKLLARENAEDLAILGSGVQARTHLEAMSIVRPVRRVRVASGSLESARRFAKESAARYTFPIEAVATAEQAIRGADIIVTATNASEPVLKREWIADGAHLNVVGSSFPRAREVDTATMAASRLFVDWRESTLNEAGDYLTPAAEGAIGPDHIVAELGEILIGKAQGRATPGEITLFKSLGLATEDLASAEYLYATAKENGAGTWVDL